MTMETSQNYSTGIATITALEGLNGILLIVFGLLSMAGLSLPWFFSARFALLAGFMMLGFAWGVWKLQRWALYLTLILAAISTATGLFGIMQPDITIGPVLTNLFIPLCILIYFIADANVRAIFHKQNW